MTPLTDEDRAVLAFAARRFRHAGSRDNAIKAEFGWSVWRYEQRLLQVCALPAALEAAPVLVNRVNKRRLVRAGHADVRGLSYS